MVAKISLLFLLVSLLCSCDSLLKIHGRVVDSSGKPVSHANVWLIYGGYAAEATTNELGQFNVGQVHGQTENLSLLVSKEGRRLYFRSVDYRQKNIGLDVVVKDGS